MPLSTFDVMTWTQQNVLFLKSNKLNFAYIVPLKFHFSSILNWSDMTLAAAQLGAGCLITITATSGRQEKQIFGAVHCECLLINRLSITQSGMSFSCRMEFLRHCGEPNWFWWRSLYIPQECILLCSRGMCGVGRDGLEFPKQLNCSGKCFFEEQRVKRF